MLFLANSGRVLFKTIIYDVHVYPFKLSIWTKNIMW